MTMSRHRGWLVVSTCALTLLAGYAASDPEIRRTADDFMTAEGSRDCPELQRLTLPGPPDPCADLGNRQFHLSMMEQTSRWRVHQHHNEATAKTKLAGSVPIEYRLRRQDDRWYVIWPQ